MSLLARLSERPTGLISDRKVPHCRTCGTPMKGHKKPNGTLTCPTALDAPLEGEDDDREESPDAPSLHDMLIPSRSPSLATSDASFIDPNRSRSRSIASSSSSSSGSRRTLTPEVVNKYPFQPFDAEPSFEIPPTGNWHRRNPHRDHTPAPPPPAVQVQPGSPRGRAMTPTEPDVPQPQGRAWTPTEIVDDDAAAAAAANARAAPRRRASGRLANALSTIIGAAPTTTITPILESFGRLCVTIYETREENLQIMRERALGAGMYSDAVPIPTGVAKMGWNGHPRGQGGEANTWFIASGSPSRVAEVRKRLLRGEPEEEGQGEEFGTSVSFRPSRNPTFTASRKGKEREFVPDEIYTPAAAAVASTSGTAHQTQPAQEAQEAQPRPPQVQIIVHKYAYDVSASTIGALISILFASFLLYAGLFGLAGGPGAGVLRK